MRKPVLVLLGAAVTAAIGLTGPARFGEPALAASSSGETSQATGVISGTIRFAGTPPQPTVIQMAADPYCLTAHEGQQVTAETLVVNDNGTLRWVFVYIKGGISVGGGQGEPVVLDQTACIYTPHVLGLQAGQVVRIRNNDPTLHNVNVQPTNNPGFNIAQPIPGMTSERSFPNPEIMITVRCDVHPWMRAYIGVVGHPFFAVSDAGGSFEIGSVPAGTYLLEAWHETLGAQTLSATVTVGATAAADFTFGQ